MSETWCESERVPCWATCPRVRSRLRMLAHRQGSAGRVAIGLRRSRQERRARLAPKGPATVHRQRRALPPTQTTEQGSPPSHPALLLLEAPPPENPSHILRPLWTWL